jgi:hypothetical protein
VVVRRGAGAAGSADLFGDHPFVPLDAALSVTEVNAPPVLGGREVSLVAWIFRVRAAARRQPNSAGADRGQLSRDRPLRQVCRVAGVLADRPVVKTRVTKCTRSARCGSVVVLDAAEAPGNLCSAGSAQPI